MSGGMILSAKGLNGTLLAKGMKDMEITLQI